MQRLWTIIDHAVPGTPRRRHRYLVAFSAGCCAALATAMIERWTGVGMPFLLGLGAVIFAAWHGGGGPTILAGAMMIGSGLLVSPRGLTAVQPINVAFLALFVALLAIASEAIEWLRRRELELVWRLSQREQYLHTLFHTLPAAMIVFNRSGAIFAINNCACQLFGVEASDAARMTLQDFIGSDQVEDTGGGIVEHIEAVHRGGGMLTGRDHAGNELSLASTITRMATPTVELWTLHIRDETGTRKTNAKLAELQAELAQIGRAAALGAMGSAIAHELNQPLASAANYLGAARKILSHATPTVPIAMAAIEGATAEIFRASETLKGLRTFVNAAPLAPDWIDTATIVDEAVELAHFTMNITRTRLIVDVAPDVGEIWVDRVQIEQVLVNLLNNAAQAVAECTRRVVRLSVVASDGDRATVSVCDSGPGIDPAVRHRLFKLFSTSKPTGLGVGLAISRTIVEAHDGRLWIDEHAEAGATFRFTLGHRRNKGGHRDAAT